MSGTIGRSYSKSKVIGKSPDTAKCWANFDGTVGSPATVRDSYNVSSITEGAIGRFTINFITNMNNDDYVVAGSHNATGTYTDWANDGSFMAYNPLVGSFQIVVNQGGTYADAEYISVLAFGG